MLNETAGDFQIITVLSRVMLLLHFMDSTLSPGVIVPVSHFRRPEMAEKCALILRTAGRSYFCGLSVGCKAQLA